VKNMDSAILRPSRSSPQSTFYLAGNLWGASLQPSMKVLNHVDRYLLNKNQSTAEEAKMSDTMAGAKDQAP